MQFIPGSHRMGRIDHRADDTLRMQRYKSAFHHTQFKSPRLGLDGTYSPAVPLDRVADPEAGLE
ncbi:MAG: hypothetical protein IH827_03965 [Myxococcales bacterium]|nr:hypothetical protein [Myxococcales bacterium]